LTGKYYPDGHGGKVYLPLGDISFADEVISFYHGKPQAIPSASDSSQALGIPDYDSLNIKGFVSLGCKGSLVLHFKDNALVNIKGPDLYVFEVGKYIEATELSISKDGRKWIRVGKIKGGKASVDIGDSVKPGEVFHYVRLTDLGDECRGNWPGADIDAVAAIGAARHISLKSSILFSFDKATLKPEAVKEFDKVLSDLKSSPGSELIIEGHTDSLGNKGYNERLSVQRALSVKNYFAGKLNGADYKILSFGYGSAYPVATNKTKEGQELNRRVEIIIVPPGN
jgi:outer membrane protein OmpA-like peptidoglycan-associated protein